MSNLTEKQKLFINEYLIDLNATRAYKEVYKSTKKDETARANSSRLLKKQKIIDYLDAQMKEREKRTEITQDKVLKELAKIGFADIKDYLEYKTAKTVVGYEEGEPIIDYSQIIDVIDSKNVDTSIIQEVSISKDGTFKFKLYDKQRALTDIGKHLGMFTDKTEISGDIGLKVIVDYGDDKGS
ncbi:terminase small subunit [Alkalibaculum sp. M08DMB]|uniref:Terminase small subunit n=1 Tax=Alkalibaculum sporogenes TaxID=2655001 RepID=A0A6A7K9H8_9FIRM|nr:terminase small subunit [Alkalibaculum sporogenes]MPW25961.1 terminase small subunit [Alkalibaculum sporogenes]